MISSNTGEGHSKDALDFFPCKYMVSLFVSFQSVVILVILYLLDALIYIYAKCGSVVINYSGYPLTTYLKSV